mgnify:CR=1 FL=1
MLKVHVYQIRSRKKRELKFYEDAINAARKELNNIDGDIDITVCGHSTGGNQHSM